MRSKIFLFLALAALATADPLEEDTCSAHAAVSCEEAGDGWSTGPCDAVYGGFRGNQHNLQALMTQHLKDSFKFLIMGSHFNTDEMNRLGIHKLLAGHSDSMWERGKSLMKYILQRGGKMDKNFRISDLDMSGVTGEVDSLATSLDLLKSQAENVIKAYKHSSNKQLHDGAPEEDSYDPGLSHMLEEDFIAPYTTEIRDMAGRLNILAKMARSDKTRTLGLHLFDKFLK